MNFDKAKEKYLEIKAPSELYDKTFARVNEKGQKPRFSVVRFASVAAACLCVAVVLTVFLFNRQQPTVRLTDDNCQIEVVNTIAPAAQTMKSASVTEGALLPIELDEACEIRFSKGRFAVKAADATVSEITSGTKVAKDSAIYIISDDAGKYTLNFETENDSYIVSITVNNKGKIRLSLKK